MTKLKRLTGMLLVFAFLCSFAGCGLIMPLLSPEEETVASDTEPFVTTEEPADSAESDAPVEPNAPGVFLKSDVEKFKIDKIFVAIPSASAKDKREILNICKESGCELKVLPGIGELVRGDLSLADMKDVAVEDLLGREPITVNMAQIGDFITGKTILVTGGGGSIGSELCRQVASYRPRKLVIFDVYENNAYEIEQELRRKWPMLDLQVRIGSVRDSRCLESVFSEYTPDIVYHAAAHKHVPLMEASPCEAIKNNVIGTYKTAYAAMCHGCKRFVLISTDKAVNPTNIMGASKRLCEMIVQMMDRRNPDTSFVAVRFGNVLGSNGSVIPLFRKQIEAGGPITLTDKRIIRYFMTIPEACRLVLEAATMGEGYEIFVFDMGKPVKIADLARNMISLAGFEPDKDIKIIYTGLRPGEKLYEELLSNNENTIPTCHKKISVAKVREYSYDAILGDFEKLKELAKVMDRIGTVKQMKAIVPEFKSKNSVYEQLDK